MQTCLHSSTDSKQVYWNFKNKLKKSNPNKFLIKKKPKTKLKIKKMLKIGFWVPSDNIL